MLDVGVIAYMDDILIYTETVEEYVALVRRVMERLRKARLCVSIKKSSFHQREVEFLGYKISDGGISMTSTKVEEIRAWSTPEKVVYVQSFMGFANFYRRFIKGFSKIAKPLTDLTKKGIKWTWTPSCQDAFDKLKEMFTTGPIVTHFDDTRPTKLETNASHFALGAVLSQLCEDEKWHPVAFHSRKISPLAINYDVHDKEMAAILAAFKQLAYMLMSVDDQILVYTDHQNLEYFNTTKTLNRKQHRGAKFLQMCNFKVIYREGWLNEKADALPRCRDYRPEGGSNSEPFTFFRPEQYIGEEPVLLRPHACAPLFPPPLHFSTPRRSAHDLLSHTFRPHCWASRRHPLLQTWHPTRVAPRESALRPLSLPPRPLGILTIWSRFSTRLPLTLGSPPQVSPPSLLRTSPLSPLGNKCSSLYSAPPFNRASTLRRPSRVSQLRSTTCPPGLLIWTSPRNPKPRPSPGIPPGHFLPSSVSRSGRFPSPAP